MAKRKKYPGMDKVEELKSRNYHQYKTRNDALPDFIGNAPNYDKFSNWSPEKVLVYLNID